VQPTLPFSSSDCTGVAARKPFETTLHRAICLCIRGASATDDDLNICDIAFTALYAKHIRLLNALPERHLSANSFPILQWHHEPKTIESQRASKPLVSNPRPPPARTWKPNHRPENHTNRRGAYYVQDTTAVSAQKPKTVPSDSNI
jgi:hypothetical protein